MSSMPELTSVRHNASAMNSNYLVTKYIGKSKKKSSRKDIKSEDAPRRRKKEKRLRAK